MVGLVAGNSLNGSMGSAVKHYSSLFFLPSFKKTLVALAVLCIGVLAMSNAFLLPSFEGLVYGLSLGLSLFVLTLLCDYITTNLVLREDVIFVMRRTAALSLFSWILWLGFIIPGAVFGAAFGFWLWVKLCLLGFSAVMTLRAVVFFSTSTAGLTRGALSSLLQPLLCVIPFLVYWATINGVSPVQVLPFLIVTPFLSLGSANLLVLLIDRLGRESYGLPAMSLFRAFMLNWVVDLNAPIEEYFEKLGQDEDVEVSLLQFETDKTKAAIIVPSVHPGPFKNLGSSLLPSLLKHEYEKAFGGDACVLLGILGHELDLASQTQNQKIISTVLASAKHTTLSDKAKPFTKVTEGFVTASCQVFGDQALLSFSLAPKTTEDLPQELGRYVREEARKRGLKGAIVVNAHNSITDVTDMEDSLDTLKVAASKCLSNAVSFLSRPFQVGAATIYPKDFSLKDGMGPGGITAIVVRVAEQKAAYVVIDGNNMVSGFREKILSALASFGFDESEVFTTDTHAVNAVVLGHRGYHPVGESMNHEILLGHIKEAASAALARLEPCTASSLTITVPKVRVIGQARIQALSTLVDDALQRAKRIVVPIFALEGLLLILLLAVL
jgi:putative membrane protein